MSCIKEKSKYAFERAKQFYFMLWCKESLIYLLFSVLVTWCCGYTVKNTLGNVLILFLMLLLGRQNVISATCVCIFLLLSACYAPVGMIYGKINNSFIASVMQTNINEAGDLSQAYLFFILLFRWSLLLLHSGSGVSVIKATGDLSFCCSLSYCQ